MKGKTGWVRACAVVALVLIAWPAVPGQSKDRSGELSDTMVKTIVEHRLAAHNLLQGNDIAVKVKDDSIFLQGTVKTLADREDVQDQAQEAEETYTVVNELSVKPADEAAVDLAEAVGKKVFYDVFYTIFDWVTIENDNGVITLQGWAQQPFHRMEYVKLAKKVPGVKQVIDDVAVLPPSLYDDQIRIRAARLIYGHALFGSYRTYENPPVHIIVDNGRVALYGYVDTPFEKQLAGQLLEGNTDAFTVDNHLEVIERKGK